MIPSYRIVPFDKDTQVPVRDLSELQAQLISRGTVALLGQRFMERFYYRFLPSDGSIFGYVAYVDDKPAGLIVATSDTAGFMKKVVCRHWPSLMWILTTSVVLNPFRWRDAYLGWRLLRNRPEITTTGQTGEILTIGVLPEYRDSDFVGQSGIRIGADFLDRALADFRARGVRQLRVCIEADNKEVKLFYLARGWSGGQPATDEGPLGYVELVTNEPTDGGLTEPSEGE